MDEQLEWVTRLFESNDVTHWVESGTLLTLVRSGHLTKYDDDIDVAILSEDVETVDGLVPQIEARDYKVQRRSYDGLTYKYQFVPTHDGGPGSRTNRRLVDVMVFRLTESHAWTAQSRLKEEFSVPAVGPVLRRAYPFIRQFARSTGGNVEVTSFPKRHLLDVLTLWLPREYVEDRTYDEDIGVHRPAAVDDYLAYRYGEWRTPVAEWSLTDDGAVREQSPAALVRTERTAPPAGGGV